MNHHHRQQQQQHHRSPTAPTRSPTPSPTTIITILHPQPSIILHHPSSSPALTCAHHRATAFRALSDLLVERIAHTHHWAPLVGLGQLIEKLNLLLLMASELFFAGVYGGVVGCRQQIACGKGWRERWRGMSAGVCAQGGEGRKEDGWWRVGEGEKEEEKTTNESETQNRTPPSLPPSPLALLPSLSFLPSLSSSLPPSRSLSLHSHVLRRGLQGGPTEREKQEARQLFLTLFNAWSLNAVATLALCWLCQVARFGKGGCVSEVSGKGREAYDLALAIVDRITKLMQRRIANGMSHGSGPFPDSRMCDCRMC
eukprot:1718810-Rhodomonas_salina.1